AAFAALAPDAIACAIDHAINFILTNSNISYGNQLYTAMIPLSILQYFGTFTDARCYRENAHKQGKNVSMVGYARGSRLPQA
ncbi:MAG TPA: hypothetical protein VH021_11810, partial [Trebonia sp.]|nr:hypothetical protein [Trebonia sp.]